MQNRTLLAKIVGIVAVVCLMLAMTLGLVACNNPTVKNVSQADNVLTVELTDGTKSEITLEGVKDAKVQNGKLVLTYLNGQTKELALDVAALSTDVNSEGKTEITLTFANGTKSTIVFDKVVASAAYENGKFVVTYTDGTTAEYAVSSVVDVAALENGQTELTYADGTTAVIGSAACEHEFEANALVKPASCYEEGVAIKVCSKCGFVASETVEKDPTIHGIWVIAAEVAEGDISVEVDEEAGIITYSREDLGSFVYELQTEYVYGSMTILEGYSGVAEYCFEATCALCGEKFASGHADAEDFVNIVVEDDEVNICENEHTVYKTCPICKSVLLYDDGSFAYNGENNVVTEKEAALGHIYGEPIVGEKAADAEGDYYPVTLVCSRPGCGQEQEVKAREVEEESVYVAATCRDDGYSYAIYEYTYTNFVDGVERNDLTGKIKVEEEEYPSTGAHLLGGTITFHAYKISDPVDEEYTADLKAYFESGELAWSEGVPATCSDHNPAVFYCKVCELPIVISLSGEHTFGEEDPVDPTCTEDGYSVRVCAVCGYEWEYNEVPASGHNYQYVVGSYSATNGTALFSCKNAGCEEPEIEVEVEVYAENPAVDCSGKSSVDYKAEVPVKGTTTAIRYFNIESDEDILYHTVKANTANTEYMKFVAYSIGAQGPNYGYNDQIKGFFEEELMAWNEGVPGTCSDYALAVFKCVVCKEQIVISLSGEHLALDPEYDDDYNPSREATCTERGLSYVFCTDCDTWVLMETSSATGHDFAPTAASWSDFQAADVKAGFAVVFECADCEEQITLYAKETVTTNTTGCVTTKTYKYDFYTAANNTEKYTYVIKNAENADKTETFAYTWSYSEYQGSHLIGSYEGAEVRVIAFNLSDPEANKYEYQDKFDFFFDDDDTLAWNEGTPGTCSDYALAVFTCVTCGEKVVFQLSGEHTFGEGDEFINIVEPDCTEAGYTERYCTSCEEWIVVNEEAALGHDYGAWTLDGVNSLVAAVENGEVVIVEGNIVMAISVCSRCQAALECEADEAQSLASLKLPTCGDEGSINIVYIFEDETVYVDTVKIAPVDEHLSDLYSAEHVIVWYEDGYYKLGYVCDACGKLVVTNKSTNKEVIDTIVAGLTAEYVNYILYGV